MKSQEQNDRGRFDTIQIDSILEQVREKKSAQPQEKGPRYPKTPKGEEWELNTILHELGIEPSRKRRVDQILIQVPGVEQEEQKPEQAPQNTVDSAAEPVQAAPEEPGHEPPVSGQPPRRKKSAGARAAKRKVRRPAEKAKQKAPEAAQAVQEVEVQAAQHTQKPVQKAKPGQTAADKLAARREGKSIQAPAEDASEQSEQVSVQQVPVQSRPQKVKKSALKETVELPQEPVFDEQPPSEEERRERRRRVEQTIQEVEEEYGTIDDGADSDPFIQDLHEEREPELPTLELPSIKAYADAEAYRLEEERRRIMEEAQREARNTIHNAAQFAMQMEITRRHMAALKEEGSEQRESYEEPEEIGMGNQLFGEVDDQFRAFFSNTVVVDKAAMDEAVNGHKKQGFFHKLFHKRSVEETAPLSGEYDALMPGTPGYAAARAEQQPEPVEELGFQQEQPAEDTEELVLPTSSAEPSFEEIEPVESDEPLLDETIEEEDQAERQAAVSVPEREAPYQVVTGSVHTDTVGEVVTEHHVEDTGGLKADVLTLKMKNLESSATPVEGTARKYNERSIPDDIEIPLGEEELERRRRAHRLANPTAASGAVDEYSTLSDAPVVAANLATMRKTRLLRLVVTGVISAVLLYLGIAAGASWPLAQAIDPVSQPLFFVLTNFVLLAGCGLISITTLSAGFMGLAQEPTTDSFAALAFSGALLQSLAYLFVPGQYVPGKITLFAPVASLILFASAVGKWMQIRMICRNFDQTSSGAEHAAAFLVRKESLAKRLCAGLGEPDPVLLISRPTALVKGFLTQSFSARLYDAMAQTLSYIISGAAVLCAVISGIVQKDVMQGISALAGALCMIAPLACTLVYAVPAELMQKYASRHKAVIPGPSAVQALGSANTVLLSATDLFPKGSVRLHGIKTFEKERIDLAIMYASSILTKHCETLKDIFLGIIENNTSILYDVESVTVEAGYGFTGWIEHNRVIIGNREMMIHHEIEIPSMDYERKYTKNGQYAAIYLAVSGKAFGMFLVSYAPNRGAARILNSLTRSGISVIVRSEDFNITSGLVANTYRIPQNTVKVLAQSEYDALNVETAYRATSDGVMIHDGSCKSFLGGMRAASCAAAGEHLARNVQAGAILLSAVVCLLLSFYAGLSGMSLGLVVFYQAAWSAITVAMPFLRRP